jgi:hypothetical protein
MVNLIDIAGKLHFVPGFAGMTDVTIMTSSLISASILI